MGIANFGLRVIQVSALLVASRIATAQSPAVPEPPVAKQVPPVLESAETPPDHEASLRYEEALRAEALGKIFAAHQIAEEGLKLGPHGRYAPALRRLDERLAEEFFRPGAERPAGPALASRVGYILSGGLVGIMGGLALGGAISGDATGAAAGGLVGVLVGVGITGLTARTVTDGSMPTHLWAGAIAGSLLAGGFVMVDGQNVSDGRAVAGILAAGLLAGAVTGAVIGSQTPLTSADGLAGLVIGSSLTGTILLLEEATGALSSSGGGNSGVVTAGATLLGLTLVGYLGGELLNRSLHWSSGRWGLVFLSAALGIGLGGLVAATVNSDSKGTSALLGGGIATGFVIGCAATTGMQPDQPRLVPSVPAADLHPPPPGPRLALTWSF